MMWRWLSGALVVLIGSASAAQSPGLAVAIHTGEVGERYDGYMGFVRPPSEEVRRQVAGINLRRRNLYIELASRRNVTADVVGVTTGCELLERVSEGEAFMLKDGIWRTRAPGQSPPVPTYCR